MISVANRIEFLISLDALKITRATGSGVVECAFCFRRRKDILDVDDSVVYQRADRDRKTAQRHRVNSDAEVAHHENRGEQRQRNRGQTDKRRAKVPEKKEQDDRNHQTAFDQRPVHVADGAFDEVGLLKGFRVDRYVRRQRGLQAGERLFDLFGEFERVGVRLFLDCGNNGRLHVETAVAALQCRTLLHSGDVTQRYRRLRALSQLSWRDLPVSKRARARESGTLHSAVREIRRKRWRWRRQRLR